MRNSYVTLFQILTSSLLQSQIKLNVLTVECWTELGQVMFYEDLSTNKFTLLYYKLITLQKNLSLGVQTCIAFSESEWSEVCVRAKNLSINTRFKLLQYNWILCTYIKPEQLNKFNSFIVFGNVILFRHSGKKW